MLSKMLNTTNFVSWLLRNRWPIIFDDGLQTRDFAHVSDVVDAIIKATSSKPHMNGKVFNIGSGRAITIESLARRLTDICGKKAFLQNTQNLGKEMFHAVVQT